MLTKKIQVQRQVQRLCVVGASMGLGVTGAQQAQAQALEPIASAHMVGGWSLVEIKDTAGSVMGFWGIPRVEVEVGNIRRLWFEALPNDEWDVWAFEPIAIYSKVDELALDGASSESIQFLLYKEYVAADSAVDLEIDGGVEGLILKGFIAGDPLADAAGALSDPDPMIDLLAEIGYPIAPGMTDMLVDGTAGANVGMNQATKELLNCLRSAAMPCGGCECHAQEGPIVISPWTIRQTNLSDGRIRCDYTRTETHFYWQWGFDPETCLVCDDGSPEDPIVFDVVVEFREYWLDIEECPPHPLGHNH